MKKRDFIYDISKASGCTQVSVKKMWAGLLEVIRDNLMKGETITFPEMFTVRAAEVPERTRYSLIEGKNCICPTHRRLRLTVSEKFQKDLWDVIDEEKK